MPMFMRVLATVPAFVLGLSACKKGPELPADADAVVVSARQALAAWTKMRDAVPPDLTRKIGPECTSPKRTLVLSRTVLDRGFRKISEEEFATERKFEMQPPPSAGVRDDFKFPIAFWPSMIETSLTTWDQQKHPDTLASLRKDVASLDDYDHIAVYRAGDSEGGCTTCGPAGTFQPYTIRALVTVFDRKTGDGVCHLVVEARNSDDIKVNKGDSEVGSQMNISDAINADLRINLRNEILKRFPNAV